MAFGECLLPANFLWKTAYDCVPGLVNEEEIPRPGDSLWLTGERIRVSSFLCHVCFGLRRAAFTAWKLVGGLRRHELFATCGADKAENRALAWLGCRLFLPRR